MGEERDFEWSHESILDISEMIRIPQLLGHLSESHT
jgi:hypothetical protein